MKLLAGGNPQIAKAEGDAPVQAYIAAMPGWKRDVGRRLDALIERTVPDVRKAVKWNSPFYGVRLTTYAKATVVKKPDTANSIRLKPDSTIGDAGWFLSFHVFTRFVKVAFFKGASLQPVPPGTSKQKDVRYVDIHEGELDEKQMASWVKQAAALPEGTASSRSGQPGGFRRPGI